MSPILNLTGLIALMGSTGSGKSSFANAILGEVKAAVNDGLESATPEVGQYLHIHPSGMNVQIVDTPGFNDYRAEGSKSDLQVLQMIGKFLKEKYDANQKFSGVIFMHNINTMRVDWQTQRRNMTLFKKLCGADSMKNVVVVTTFWDELSNLSDGIQREAELQVEGGLLKELYDGGAKFVRYGHFASGARPQDPAFLTPQEVVDYLLRLDPVYVEMQKEMAAGASIADTAAGSSLLEEFEKHKRETRESLDRMREELELIKSADDVDRSHREELKQETKRMQEQLKSWEKDGDEMRMKLAQWDKYREQIATKEELEALVSRSQKELGSLQGELLKLRDANVKSHQIDQERIDELIQTLARVRKDRDNLAEECKTLRSGYENGYRDHLQDFKSSFTDVTRIYDREMASVRAALSSRDEELKQAREASTRCQQELSDSKALYHESRRELEVAKASLQRNQKEFGNLKALHEQLNGNYDRLHKELDGVKSEKQTLESRNKELAEQVKEATLDANGKAATEDFKSKLSQNFQKAATAMQSEAQILRMEKEQYQRELEGRDDTIAKLMQELETLRSQRPAEASYPSPGSEPRDPYGAWDGPGGGLLAVQMPEPSVSPCSPSFPMAPSSPPSRIPPRLPPRPQSTASNHPPFPSTDIHVDISFGGAQGGGYPPPNQQAMRRPVPRPPTRNGMGFNNSHLGPQVKRARTPQLQPSGWYDENDRNAPPAWAPRLMPPSVGGWN